MKNIFLILMAFIAMPLAASDAFFHESITVADGVAGQRYFYIGQIATARGNLPLADVRSSETGAIVPAGDAVLVLLADTDNNYLLRTRFGSIGWLAADAEVLPQDALQEDLTKLQALEHLPNAFTAGKAPRILYNPERIKALKPEKVWQEQWALLEGRFGTDETIYRLECLPDPKYSRCTLFTQEQLAQRDQGQCPDDCTQPYPGGNFLLTDRIYFPGNGNIYRAGSLTNIHGGSTSRVDNSRRLSGGIYAYNYVWTEMDGDEQYSEYYSAAMDFPLHDEPGSEMVIAQVKAGGKVSVMLYWNDTGHCYCRPDAKCKSCRTPRYMLIKTPDNILGWTAFDREKLRGWRL